MRILFGTDGSAAADRALSLVATTPWPEGTRLDACGVVFDFEALFAEDWAPSIPPNADRLEERLVDEMNGVLDRAVERLRAAGIAADARLLRGRPASRLVEEATTLGVDLVIVGSRGLGPFRSMLLGSVSAEVVDRAPCPVLVARGEAIGSTLLAEDGSEGARRAADLLTSMPFVAGERTHVVSVASVPSLITFGLAPLPPEAIDLYAESLSTVRADSAATAQRTVDRLRAAGVEATPMVLEGDPAMRLVEAAADRGVGLVVMGSRGRTGIARLVLGSVARNVLQHAHCSVLIVHGQGAAEP